MHWIKELYKIDPVQFKDLAKIRRAVVTAIVATTIISIWRQSWVPVSIAGVVAVLAAVQPAWIGGVLTMLMTAMAFVIHSFNLGMLTVTYFLVVTPLGIAFRLNHKAKPWRANPTEIPVSESFLRPY